MTTMKYSRLLDKMKIRGSEPHNIGLKDLCQKSAIHEGTGYDYLD